PIFLSAAHRQTDRNIHVYISSTYTNAVHPFMGRQPPRRTARGRVPRASANFQLDCLRFKMLAAVDLTDAEAPVATRNTRRGGSALPTGRRRGSPASILARIGRSAPARSGC